ncbi:MAG TPA: hypothetical protein VFA86_10380 [Gammaproteobacteria bacterium]|nr:hypothetical protein [Gammaproteobacteria bacterium]
MREKDILGRHGRPRSTRAGRIPAMLVAAAFAGATLLGASIVAAPGGQAWAQPARDHDQRQKPRKQRQKPGNARPPARSVRPPARSVRPPARRTERHSREVRRDSQFRFIYTYHGAPARYHSRPRPRYWHRGHWFHGWYGPYFGWWWVLGTTWYLYPAPVYPYPTVVVEPAPPAAVVNEPSAPAPPQYWYYCPESQSYYPYVSDCPGGWQKVPASPSSGGTPDSTPPSQGQQ